jgi:amidohydrolase
MGTPAEERGGGKEVMAQHGAFDGIDAAMMVHPAGFDMAWMPSIALAEVEAVYHGRAAHASAMAHRGLNALDAVVSAYQAIAQLRQHIQQTERIHGIITEGGLAPNIVPERAACRFFIRARNGVELAELKKRVRACFEGSAMSTGTRLELRWGQVDCLDLKNNMPLADTYVANARRLGREFLDPDHLPPGLAGSTDMGNVSHRVPSIHPLIAVSPPSVVIHNADFTAYARSPKGDQAVVDGAKVCRSPIAGTVVRVLAQPGQSIQVGDVLLVLEAMKMETNITAPVAAKISAINAKAGEAVQSGQVVVEFE